jgi:hypothetical protein
MQNLSNDNSSSTQAVPMFLKSLWHTKIYEVHTAMSIKLVFWDVTSCSLTNWTNVSEEPVASIFRIQE